MCSLTGASPQLAVAPVRRLVPQVTAISMDASGGSKTETTRLCHVLAAAATRLGAEISARELKAAAEGRAGVMEVDCRYHYHYHYLQASRYYCCCYCRYRYYHYVCRYCQYHCMLAPLLLPLLPPPPLPQPMPPPLSVSTILDTGGRRR